MQMISEDGDEYEMFKGHSALDDIAMLENLMTQMVDFGVDCVTLTDKKTGKCLFSARSGIPEKGVSK